ncbi:MAG: hypothetical protein VW440_07370 [Bordetella sp.]|jgi:branched-chain amino acid transport system substrate-binding protein
MLPEQQLDSMSQTRRDVLRAGGALTLLSASGQALAANGRTVRIGWVSPRTGPLAPFGEVD